MHTHTHTQTHTHLDRVAREDGPVGVVPCLDDHLEDAKCAARYIQQHVANAPPLSRLAPEVHVRLAQHNGEVAT